MSPASKVGLHDLDITAAERRSYLNYFFDEAELKIVVEIDAIILQYILHV